MQAKVHQIKEPKKAQSKPALGFFYDFNNNPLALIGIRYLFTMFYLRGISFNLDEHWI